MCPRATDFPQNPQRPDASHIRLDLLPRARRAEVVELHCASGAIRRLGELGILVGAILQVRRSAPLGGPILVEVQGSMVALGRRLAHRVFVRVLP
jgi:ferrous iron transport protein A